MRRSGLGLALACLLAAGIHLLRPNREAHSHDVPLPGGVRYAFNADSALFARDVVRFPQGLWDCDVCKVRILRPLYPALGRIVYLPLSTMRSLVPESLTSRVRRLKETTHHPEMWEGIDERALLVAWGALIVVNLVLSWLSALVVLQALERVFPGAVAFWLTLVALFHFDAIDFIVVPHSEIFNLVVPALVLDALTRGRGRPEPARLAAGLLGVLMLGKALAFPILNWLRGRRPAELALLLALFALPVALYSALLVAFGLPLYNHEIVVYRQGVWMLDWLREGRAAEIPWRWARGLGAHLANLALGFGVPLLACLALLLRKPRSPAPAPWLRPPLVLYGLACVAFFVLLGYDPPRLSVLHFPWVLAALGTLAVTRTDRPGPVVATVVALQVVLRVTTGLCSV